MNPQSFQTGDKVAFICGDDGKRMVFVPYLREGRIYCVREVVDLYGMERVLLVGHRVRAQFRSNYPESVPAGYFRLVHRADNHRPRKEAA